MPAESRRSRLRAARRSALTPARPHRSPLASRALMRRMPPLARARVAHAPAGALASVLVAALACARLSGDLLRSTSGSGPLPEERLRAGPVADDVDGVELCRVAGGVEQARAARGGALPDPPAVLRIERGALGRQRVGEALPSGDEGRDARRALGLGLARVRVVLADVRGHAPL